MIAIRRGAIVAALFCAMALIAWVVIHRPAAADPVDLVQVQLADKGPLVSKAGLLEFRGGLDIPRSGINLGGLSALRWDEETQSLLALSDDARAVWITPKEVAGQLIGISDLKQIALLGLNGKVLSGKTMGDSEALTRSIKGGWLVAFERNHRVWHYPSLGGLPQPIPIDPTGLLGPLDDNAGVEAMAGHEGGWFGCSERMAEVQRPNCIKVKTGGAPKPFAAIPPKEVVDLGSLPTDADRASDGTLFVLFRSYSKLNGNTAAIVAYSSNGERQDLAILQAPLTVDNFEGLAVRDAGVRRFVYLVSDDNFSGSQRTLLMKFEVMDVMSYSPPPPSD